MAYLKIKEKALCYCKRMLFLRGTDLIPSDLPLFSFSEEDVTFVLNTTNNTIKTPLGFFRICFEHFPFDTYVQKLTDFYYSVPEKERPQRGLEFFIKKGVRDWTLNGGAHKYQTYNACSSMAEEIVAELFGVERLFTKSFFCKLKIGDMDELVGTMSSFADGIDVRDLKDCYRDGIAPELVRDLTTLNLIDAVCYEKDHRPGNYHIILDSKGKAVSICSFDNDSPWSFAPFGSASFQTYAGASQIIREGLFNRPMLDVKVKDRLLRMTKNDLRNALSRYMANNQVNACWRRVKVLQKAVDRTKFAYTKWSEAIMKDELSGKYGNTYYSVLYRLCELIEAGKY